MRCRTFVQVAALSLSLTSVAVATPGQDMVTASLQAQGFEVTMVHWTWLGRIRIIAVSADVRREIVINPTTGEILRDYSQKIAEAAAPSRDEGSHSGQETSRIADPAAAAEVDASAMTALEGLVVGVAPALTLGPDQN